MSTYRNNRFAGFALLLFFLLIAGYAYYEARNILWGPKIVLGNSSVITVNEQMVLVRGTAENITEIRFNGGVIPVTEEGAFEEPYLLAEGYNRIVLTASDKLDRQTSEILEIIYKPVEQDSTTQIKEADLESGSASSTINRTEPASLTS